MNNDIIINMVVKGIQQLLVEAVEEQDQLDLLLCLNTIKGVEKRKNGR